MTLDLHELWLWNIIASSEFSGKLVISILRTKVENVQLFLIRYGGKPVVSDL